MTTFVMESIYNCQFSKLPFQLLMHRFLNYFKGFMPDMVRYGKCCKAKNPILFGRLDECNKHIRPFCRTRFGENVHNQRTCSKILYNNGAWYSDKEHTRHLIETNHEFPEEKINQFTEGFVKYFECLEGYSDIVLPCAIKNLDTPCLKYPIRAVKTVRAFADIDAALMQKYDNFRYIHLLRDPRGTAKSRFLQSWARGFFEKSDPGKIAGSYCTIGHYNEQFRYKMESKHPGKTTTLIFDDITANPRVNVEKLFRFIGENVTSSATQWLRKLERGRQTKKNPKRKRKEESERMDSRVNTSDIVRETQWKVFFKYSEVESMQRMCLDFFKTIKYDWDGLNILRWVLIADVCKYILYMNIYNEMVFKLFKQRFGCVCGWLCTILMDYSWIHSCSWVFVSYYQRNIPVDL